MNPDTTGKTLGTIGSNSGTSNVFDLRGARLVGIETPNTLTGGTITFQASVADDGTFRPVYDVANNQLSVIVGTNQIHTDIPELAPLRHVKLIMGTQAADRIFTVITK